MFPYDLSPEAIKEYLVELHREVEFMAGCITDKLEEALSVLEPSGRRGTPEMI